MGKYLLHINEPCTQSWDEMTPTEKGRFCGSCQKTVFDFTTATDNEIIRHLEKMNGNMFCGQFEEGQLNRWMEKTKLESNNPTLYKYLLSFLLLTAGQQVMAQKENAKQEIVVSANKTDSISLLKSEKVEIKCKDKAIKDTAQKVILRGRIRCITNNNEPLIIIDGVAGEKNILEKLNPNDIESVDVLKGASATALYGAKATNGAILITTKKAKKAKEMKTRYPVIKV